MFRRKKKTRIEQARENIEKNLKIVDKQAKQTRKEIIKSLNETATNLRSNIDHVLSREEQKRADKVATELENIAKTMEKRAGQTVSDVTESAQNNVWGSVAIAFVAGAIFAFILKNIVD